MVYKPYYENVFHGRGLRTYNRYEELQTVTLSPFGLVRFHFHDPADNFTIHTYDGALLIAALRARRALNNDNLPRKRVLLANALQFAFLWVLAMLSLAVILGSFNSFEPFTELSFYIRIVAYYLFFLTIALVQANAALRRTQ